MHRDGQIAQREVQRPGSAVQVVAGCSEVCGGQQDNLYWVLQTLQVVALASTHLTVAYYYLNSILRALDSALGDLDIVIARYLILPILCSQATLY